MKKAKSIESHSPVHAPTVRATVLDGASGWLVCISCMIGWFLIGGITTSFGIISPTLKNHFGQNTTIISLVGTLPVYLADLLGTIAASLTKRFGLRAVYMVGSMVTGVSFVASTFSPDAYLLLVTYGICSGIGISLIMLPISVGCNYYFDKKLALATGISKAGSSIGSIVLPPLVELLLDTYNWKIVFYLFATTAFFICIFEGLIGLLEVIHAKKDKENISKYDEETTSTDPINLKKDYLSIQRCTIADASVDDTNLKQTNLCKRLNKTTYSEFLNDPAILFFFASRFFGTFSLTIFLMFLPIILVEHHFSMKQGSLMFIVIGIPNMFFRVIFGAIMDHPRVDCLVLNAISSTAFTIIMGMFTFYDTFMVLIILLGLVGVTIAPFQVNTTIALAQMLPLEKVASGYGICSFAFGIAGIFGPVLAGYIFDHTTDHRVLVLLVALGNLLCGVACLITYYLNVRRKNC